MSCVFILNSLKQSFPLLLYFNNHRLNDSYAIPSSSEIENIDRDLLNVFHPVFIKNTKITGSNKFDTSYKI